MYAVYEIIIKVNTAMLNKTKNMPFYKTHNTLIACSSLHFEMVFLNPITKRT